MAAKDRRVTIRLPEEVFVRLSEKAGRNDVSVAWLIRRALMESLSVEKPDEAVRRAQRDVSSRLK